MDADPSADARSFAEGGAAAGAAAAELAGYAGAADALRAAGRVNRLRFRDTVYQIVRTRRLPRWGPGGPEGPRPSDVDGQDPARIHLPLDEDGNVHPEE
ncbi:DUF5954 family protein [Streptomyces sp. NPDC051130]|uniref:DUF5954 family protein n=1 Tax=Streptomyces sp. NPDC051130 TaxID=3157223 RepID=UPI0034409FA8